MKKTKLSELERRRSLRSARARRQATDRDIPVVDENAVEEVADVDEVVTPKVAPKRSAAPRFHRSKRPSRGRGSGIMRGREGQEPEEDIDFDVLELGPEDVEEIGEEMPDFEMELEEAPEEEIEEKVDEIEERVEAIEEEVGIEPPEKEEEGRGEEDESVPDDAIEEEEEEAEDEGEGGETEASLTTGAKDGAFWAPLANKEALLAVDDPEITMSIFNAETVDPHYVLFANGHPFGELRLSDIQGTPGHEELFISDEYVPGVLGGIEKIGLSEMLDTLSFRWYADETTLPKAAEKIRTEVKADTDEAYKTRVAEIKGELLGKLDTALNASLKNFILQNPLKDALVENLRKAGFDNEPLIVDIIEDAFRRNGSVYLAELVGVADKWMGYTAESYTQVKDEIDNMDYVHPLDRSALYEDEPEEDVTTASFPTSIPLRTLGGSPPQEQQNDWDRDAELIKPLMRKATTVKANRR